MVDDDNDDADPWDVALDAIWDRVNRRLAQDFPKDDIVLDYSAYGSDADDVPIDNLGEVPVPGRVKFVAKKDPFFGGKDSKDYESPVLENPTWLELCVHANAMILKTNDHHHCFLEGLEILGHEGDTQIAKFSMGS